MKFKLLIIQFIFFGSLYGQSSILAITAVYPDNNRGAFMMTNVSADMNGAMMKSLRSIWLSLKIS